MESWATVILAAGRGKRMKSSIPKVLHPIAGRPMISYVLEAAAQACPGRMVMVIGHGAERVQETLKARAEYVVQEEQLGTGHALLQARPLLEGASTQLLVLNGDVPLISPATLRSLTARHIASAATITFLSCTTSSASGLGRVLRDGNGEVKGIVEDALFEGERSGEAEVNAGVYCFDSGWVWANLSLLKPSPSGEFYLTDLVELAVSQGLKVETEISDDLQEAVGVNDRVQLARAEAVIRARIAERAMLSGVTLIDPATTYIDTDVEIGEDTVVYPNTTISGGTKIGKECKIGPNSIITDSHIGDRCRVLSSVIEESVLEEDVDIGPFSHLRPESYIGARTHIGNYGEVKKSRLGKDVKMGHFSYVGDAQVGDNVNIGAGAITCNYDGVDKHVTVIGDNAFIGCDTMLVAPVTVGAGAVTGAGAVVTQDVPPGALVVGVPAKVVNKQGR